MPRLSPVATEAMSGLQREVAAEVASGPRGVARGPIQMWLHSPEFARIAQRLGAHCRFGSALPARLSELAILVTGAHWQSGYEWHGHEPLARQAGLSDAVIEAVRTGATPVFGHKDEAVVHAFASEVWKTGNVSGTTWTEAEHMLGAQALVDLVGTLGYYGLISMTINVFGIEVPAGAPDPFGR